MKALAALRILVIEDDPRMVDLLYAGLTELGHRVQTVATAEDGQRTLDHGIFDAVVLESGLPDGGATSIVKALRDRPHPPAIVLLTAENPEDQCVSGLDGGADDSIAKPFAVSDLAARIVSAVRRTRAAALEQFSFGPYELNLSKRRLYRDHVEVHITRSEYLLLRMLATNRGEVVGRRQLMQAVWGTATMSHGSLEALVNTLRIKLNDDEAGLIATARGNGYSLLAKAEQRSA